MLQPKTHDWSNYDISLLQERIIETSSVQACTISPDDSRLMAVDRRGCLFLFDLTSIHRVHEAQEMNMQPLRVCNRFLHTQINSLCNLGSDYVVMSSGGSVRILDWNMKVIHEHGARVDVLCLNIWEEDNNNARIVMGCSDGRLLLAEWVTKDKVLVVLQGSEKAYVTNSTDGINAVSFLEDKDSVAWCSQNGNLYVKHKDSSIQIINPSTFGEGKKNTRTSNPLLHLTVDTTRRWLVCSDSASAMYLFYLPSMVLVSAMPVAGQVQDVCFSRDGVNILCISNEPYIYYWTKMGKYITRVRTQNTTSNFSISQAHHNNLVCVSGNSKDISVFIIPKMPVSAHLTCS